jgi:hypothetical protein
MSTKPLRSLAAALLVTALAAPALAADAPASLDPRVKFKDGERLLRDLSSALDIPRDKVCKELGQYDCFNDAFRIVLGGVDAEYLGINQPLEQEALTAPIAVDRVALHVCTTRVEMDLAAPEKAVLLKPLARPARGKPPAAWMRQTVSGVYESILRREASRTETAQLVGFYNDVARTNGKANPNALKDWVTLGCFAVASSLENVFY